MADRMSMWSSDTELDITGKGEDPDYPEEKIDVAVHIGTGQIRLALHNEEFWHQVVISPEDTAKLITSLQYQLAYSGRIIMK
jgi:hypothetical protein